MSPTQLINMMVGSDHVSKKVVNLGWRLIDEKRSNPKFIIDNMGKIEGVITKNVDVPKMSKNFEEF